MRLRNRWLWRRHPHNKPTVARHAFNTGTFNTGTFNTGTFNIGALWLVPVLLAATLLAAGAQPTGELTTSSPGEASDPVSKLTALLGTFDTIHASFLQWPPPGEGEAQSGEFWLQKPASFRVETGPPLSQTIVSDGQSLWTHDRELEQVIISPLDLDVARTPLLLLAGDARDIGQAFVVDSLEREALDQEAFEDSSGRQDIHFILTPHDENHLLSRITLTFSRTARGAMPASIAIENAMARPTLIEFNEVEPSPRLTGEEFRFVIPEAVDVIDDRN